MNASQPVRSLAAVAVIAATYVFFLLFAEFALLHLMEARAANPAALRFGLAWLGGGGVFGSLLAARFGASLSLRRAIALGFVTCGIAATSAALLPATAALEPVAALTGLGLGWLTVNVAGNLHRLLAGAPLGLCTGAGTGLAYAFCNLPGVFTSSPIGHAWIGAAACLVGALATAALSDGALRDSRPTSEVSAGAEAPRSGAEREPFRYDASTGRRATFWLLLAACVALVWLDSAAFLLIQERPGLRALTWATDRQLWTNAGVHFLAALLGGWLLDRKLLRFALALAGADLLAASFALAHGGPAAARLHLLYPMGVSLYSTALVALPALARTWPGGVNVVWRAAWLYVLAGWIGSALGIGMALDQRNIPDVFLLVAGAALAAVLLGSLRGRAITATAAVLICGLLFASPELRAASADDPIAAGRAVYIAEGCIHCHSQFVRPGTQDELLWGPSRPLAEMLKEEPPLPGNRRQGPDLQNVGNRRSPDWNRVHLQAPRSLAPASAMPRYTHLFRAGDPRGEALVAYLASLGADTTEARARTIAAWTPPAQPLGHGASSPAGVPPAPQQPRIAGTEAGATDKASRGAQLFASLCACCHGADARGHGPLAAKLAVPPADLVAGPRPRTARASAEATQAELARVIRFGVPGTAMAGHETLPETDIAALTAVVAALKLPAAPP